MKLRNCLILIVSLVILVLNLEAFGGCPCDKKVVVKTVDFTGGYRAEGFWAAMHAATDGKVYVALCGESGGHAQFYIYDPVKDKMRHRADLAKFLGGSGKGIRTHAKVHSKLVEDSEGNIYFATGNMGAGPDEVDPMSWEGGHWIKYDPKTDKLEDLGLASPHAGIYGLAIDKERKRLLGVNRNGHFMVHDIETGRTFDKGRVNLYASTSARTVVSDDEGNAYGTFRPDRIFKYDAEQERVLDLSVRLPSDPTVYPRTNSIVKKYMRAGAWDDINKKMYGVQGGTSILFEYDPKVGKEGSIRELDRLLPCQPTEELRKSHFATLNFTIGKDRKIYYMPIGSLTPKEHERMNKGVDFFNWTGQGYLISYDLNIGQKKCLGRVYTEDGKLMVGRHMAAPSGGAGTGPDGTIYFCGYVEEKNPELAGLELGNIGMKLKLLIYKP